MNFMCHGLRFHAHRAENTGTPVVFQHGLCGSATQTAEAFPPNSPYRLYTLECRGHGASEAGPFSEFSITTFAEDLAAFITEQDLAPCIVGGISMGAAIAAYLAVHHKHLVKALVLARPAWTTMARPPNILPNVEVGMLLHQFSPEQARAKFEESPTVKMLAREAPDNLASLRSFFTREPIDATAALLTKIGNSDPGVTEQDLRALTIPTLIVGHQRDFVHPFALARQLHHMIPTSKLVEITPKALDKQAYLSEFQSSLLQFFNEVHCK